MDFHRRKLRSTTTTFTVSQTCEVPVIYREMVNPSPEVWLKAIRLDSCTHSRSRHSNLVTHIFIRIYASGPSARWLYRIQDRVWGSSPCYPSTLLTLFGTLLFNSYRLSRRFYSHFRYDIEYDIAALNGTTNFGAPIVTCWCWLSSSFIFLISRPPFLSALTAIPLHIPFFLHLSYRGLWPGLLT